MLRYVDTKVVFRELPDEITLAINLSGCPCHCKGCHSSYLADDIGEELTFEALKHLVDKHDGISAICFMGGDGSPEEVRRLAAEMKSSHKYGFLHIGWYSGRQELPKGFSPKTGELLVFDYIKLGPYIAERGALDSETTNQRLFRIESNGDGERGLKMIDITEKMRHKTFLQC